MFRWMVVLLAATGVQSTPIETRIMDQDSTQVATRINAVVIRRTSNKHPFSMGGKLYEQGVFLNPTSEADIAAFVPKGAHSVHLDFGVADELGWDKNRKEAAHFELLVDGAVVKSGDLTDFAPPITCAVDVTGKRSIGIRLRRGAAIGDPVFSTVPVEAAGSNTTKPLLQAPKDGATVSGDVVHLKWAPIKDAVSYGVILVSLKLQDATVRGSRIWAYNVDGSDPSYALSLKGLPAGDYLWSVLAFGVKSPIGVYSSEWSLTVEKD